MHYTLTSAAPDNPAAELPLFGGTLLRQGEEHPAYGFVGVELFAVVSDDVRTAADFLGQAPPEQWGLDRNAGSGADASWVQMSAKCQNTPTSASVTTIKP